MRTASLTRTTGESRVELTIDLDGSGRADIDTGVGFYDHMLHAFTRHGLFDLTVRAKGDLHVDVHHTVEDTAIVLGEALAEALGDKTGVRRFASILLPLDEALVEVALDLSGRPFCVYEIEFPADVIALGTPPFDPHMAEHFFQSFATAAQMTLHVRLRSGRNTHHILEACFKGVARCLRDAVRVEGGGVPSTKGAL